MKKTLMILLLLFLVVMGGGAGWGYRQLAEFAALPIHKTSDQLLTVERGTTGAKLAQLLEQQGLVDNAAWLPWLLRFKPELNKVKVGTYDLNRVDTVQALMELLNSGREAQFSIRFAEGKTFKNWRTVLENSPHLQQTLTGKSEAEIAALLGLGKPHAAAMSALDGRLYPDTYHYAPNSTDLAVLKRAADRMTQALTQAWAGRAADLPLKTPEDMLILASIVEKETGLDGERAKVASVFVNRLNRNMKLQTDPTVIYGMGDAYQGNIRKRDLETPTPYNTYVIDGLPPSPIAMPSEASLKAVSQPEKTDYLYFVANGTGGHQFSRTLAEHNKAVQAYLRWYRSQHK